MNLMMVHTRNTEPLYSQSDQAYLHGASPEQVWKWSDDKVLSLMQIPDPQDMLHLARLSFYTTAFHTGPDELWVLLLAEKSWIRCVHSAIHWMYDQLKGSTNFAGLHDFEEDWVRGVQNRGPKWRGWVKRAVCYSASIGVTLNHGTLNFMTN